MAELTEEEREKLERSLVELKKEEALMEALNQQVALLTATLSELSSTIETIKRLKEAPPEVEILTPVGSGSFVRARLLPLERVLMGIGANVVVERTPEEAMQFLEEKSSEIGRALQELREEMARVLERMEALRPEIEKLLSKARG